MKRALVLVAGVTAVAAAVIVVLILVNARDPYGGPIEPPEAH